MRNTNVIPVDKNGNAVQVFIPDTAKTVALDIADAETVATTSVLSPLTESLAYLTLDKCSGSNTITFRAKMKGYPSENISVGIDKDRAALAVTVTQHAIMIVYDGGTPPTCSDVKAAIEAHPVAKHLVSVEYTSGDAKMDNSNVAAACLSGYSDGETPVIVRMYAEQACNIHVGSLAATGKGECKMPLGEGQTDYVAIMPGEIISAVGLASVSEAKLHLTPGRRM